MVDPNCCIVLATQLNDLAVEVDGRSVQLSLLGRFQPSKDRYLNGNQTVPIKLLNLGNCPHYTVTCPLYGVGTT